MPAPGQLGVEVEANNKIRTGNADAPTIKTQTRRDQPQA